jgi:hypothetical protein
MPCNFEVNLITRLGVIALFSLFFLNLKFLSDISKTIRDKDFVSFYCQVNDTGSVG